MPPASSGARYEALLAVIADEEDGRLPPLARMCLAGLANQYLSLHEEISAAEKRIHAWHRSNEVSLRLATIQERIGHPDG